MQPHPRTSFDPHRKHLFGILAVLALVVACTPTPEPASIVGTVIDANTLAALADASIVAQATGTATVVATTTSDAAGAFALEPLDAGNYDVELVHFGYAPQTRANVALLAGATADLGDVGLAAYAPSRLYGSVASDEAFSMPLTGARVDARIAGTTTVVATAFADEHASFDLDPVPAGTYDVELSHAGYVTLLVEGVVAPPGGAGNVGDRRLVPIAP